jgi:DNA-binding NarL/FixJ family response regulator
MSSSTPTVLVAAAPTLQRQGLLFTLGEVRPTLSLSTTTNAHDLPDRLRREAPALLILDSSLPGPPLTELLSRIRLARPQQRLLVLGGRRLPLSISRYLVEQGVGSLLVQHLMPADVIVAVQRLLQHLPILQEPLPSYLRLSHNDYQERLSSRELEVLQLVVQDCSTPEIAAQLCISPRTVDSHRRMLLQKAGVRTSVGLVLHAVRRGWVEIV